MPTAARQYGAKGKSKRKNSRQRGYTYQWEKARRLFLRDNPLCETCHNEGRITAAAEVDHVIPHNGDMVLFWKRSNWSAKCKSCHSKKTRRENDSH